MPTYRVKPGHRFGVGKAKGPGDLVELTTVEAAGFLDKLEPVEDEPEPAVLAVVGGVAGDTSDDAPTPAPDLPALWATQAPSLNPRVVEVMLKHALAPAVVAGMSDDALLALDGIGPSTLRSLRELGA